MNEIFLSLIKRIEALELLVASNTKNIAQYGTVAPTTVVPAFKGQIYVNTATQKGYVAYGTAAGEWSILN